MTTAARRLAALESKLIPQPDTYREVRSPAPALSLYVIASTFGRYREGRSELQCYARALGLSVEKLWAFVNRKPEKWWQRHLAVSPTCPFEMQEVRDAVILDLFVCEEIVHQLVELLIAAGWRPGPIRQLCKYRPSQPMGHKAPTAEDLIFAE